MDPELAGTELAALQHMSGRLAGIIVVVVEDDPDSLDLLRVIMEHDGALVIPAPNAKSALETLGRLRPTVLVSDMTMPQQDGKWLVTEARRAGLLPDVPALAVTALTMTQQEVRDAGFNGYLQKPVNPALLARAGEIFTHRPS